MGRSADPEVLFRGRHAAASWSICALVSLYAFEEMGVAATLPRAVAELGGLRYFGWVYTGFLAASIVGMSAAAHLNSRYGPGPPLIACATVFVAGLVIAGAATSMGALICARVVQGFSGGGLMTSAYVAVGTLVPDGLRPRLISAIAFCWVAPGILGPLVSGALTEGVGWRWVFLGLAPVTVAAAAVLAPALSGGRPNDHPPLASRARAGRGPARVVAAVVSAGGVAAIQAGAERPSAMSAGAVAIGAIALLWALGRLLPRGTALVRTAVGAPVAIRGINAAAFFGVETMIPLMLTTQHGSGPLSASIPLACAGLPCFLSAWWVGRLPVEAAVGQRVRLARCGFVLLGIADASFVWLAQPGGPGWLMAPMWSMAGFGIGLIVPTANVLVLDRTCEADRASDVAALQIADTTASCITTGFAGVLIALASRGTFAYPTAFGVIGASMALICLIGVLAAGRLRPPAVVQTPAYDTKWGGVPG